MPIPLVRIVLVLVQQPIEDKVINNSRDLLALTDKYEGIVEVVRRHSVYVTTDPITDADIQNYQWIFVSGRLDGWADKLHSYYTSTTPIHRACRYASLAAERRASTAARGGEAQVCHCRAEPEHANDVQAAVGTVEEGRWMDLFYEIFNSKSVVFVGAILKSVTVPLEAPHRVPPMMPQKVESVEDSEACVEGVIGIIC